MQKSIRPPPLPDRYARGGAGVGVYWRTSEGGREVRRKRFDLSLGRAHRLILSVGLRRRDVLHQSPVALRRSSIAVEREWTRGCRITKLARGVPCERKRVVASCRPRILRLPCPLKHLPSGYPYRSSRQNDALRPRTIINPSPLRLGSPRCRRSR